MRITRLTTEIKKKEAEEVDLTLLDSLIARYKGQKGNVIPLLQGAQDIYGYLPRAVFEKISQETGLELNEMFGVATFYAQFRLAPVGRHIIKVCHGTACHVQNANEITESLEETLKVKDGETTEDRFFTLESVACLGCCSLAPVMMIDGSSYGKLTKNEALKVIKNIRISESN
jgi:NADH-quinone oxidoreductase subunit E